MPGRNRDVLLPMAIDGAKGTVHRFAVVEWGVTDQFRRRPGRLFRP